MRPFCSTPSCRLRAGYLLAMGLVLCSVVVGHVVWLSSADEMADDARLINIAGRQRMLGQRIVAQSGELARLMNSPEDHDEDKSALAARADFAAQELREARADWRSAQSSLWRHFGGTEDEPPAEDEPGIAAVFERMAPSQDRVLAASEVLLGAYDDGRAATRIEVEAAADAIMHHAEVYLPAMHEAVGLIERHANTKLASHLRIEGGLDIAIVLVVIGSCVLVFEPLVRWHAILTRRLEANAEAAEAGSRAKTAFLANMSHEIRTPMTAIMGYSKLIADEISASPADLADWGRTIETNAEHLLALINDILDVSKIEAGRMTLERVETDPAAIVGETLALLRLHAADRSITLDAVYETPIPDRIETDPVRLRQILVNIVGNSIKFTERGGVTMRVACLPDDERLRIRVEDTGIGLTDAQLEKIRRCEAFTQADASTTRRYGGTGLGLKLCRTLLDLMGGTIAIESERGSGSAFTITVPTGSLDGRTLAIPEVRADSSDETPAGDANGTNPVQSEKILAGVRVLLAEDGVDNRRLIERFLSGAGAEIRCVENGADAVDAAISDDGWAPDVVLMDMQMPVLDGVGATRQLRELGFASPVIALTANAMEADRRVCLAAGCDDYLTKPIDRATLVDRCASWAERRERGGSTRGPRSSRAGRADRAA